MGARSRWFFCCISLYWLAIGCGGDGTVAPAVDEPTGNNADSTAAGRELAFPDSGLAAAVRAALGQSVGPITVGPALGLSELDAHGREIADLRGIGELANLRVLELRDNRIIDLTPLASLSRLAFLDLENNQVSDLTPLAGLDSLQALIADFNQIRDPSPLVGLPCLRSVELVGNPITAAMLRQFKAAMSGVSVTGPDTTIADSAAVTSGSGPATPVAFISWRHQCNGIYLVDFVGRQPGDTRLLAEDDAWSPIEVSWAPDAASLIMSLILKDGSGVGLYRLANDGTFARLTTILETDAAPAWSPDGEWLALFSKVEGDYELWVMRADGTEPRRLTYSAGNDFPESWSPDGEWIAFTSARNGNDDIWLIHPDGTGAIPLTDDPATDTRPTWSPDGEWLAFVSDRSGDYDIWVMRADGSQARNLTDNPAADTSPTWSPDGQWLAFASDRDQGDQEIYVVPAMGGTAINLTDHPGPDRSPRWAPGPVTGFSAPVTSNLAVFADPDLVRAIRRAVGASTRDLATEDLLAITNLELGNANIDDLGGLERLTNLKTLLLGNQTTYVERDGHLVPDSSDTWSPFSEWNQVRDLSPLAGLIRLERLGLGLNAVEDLTPLSDLTRLKRLDLSFDPVEDLAPLASLTQLTHLFVDPVSNGDLSPLRSLTRLHNLSVGGSAVEDLAPLTDLTGLTALYVTGGRVRDLTPLANLTKLIYLGLSYNRIEDVGPLASLPRLIRLDLKQNQIRDLGPLAGLTGLNELILTGNPLDQKSLDTDLPALRARGVRVEY